MGDIFIDSAVYSQIPSNKPSRVSSSFFGNSIKHLFLQKAQLEAEEKQLQDLLKQWSYEEQQWEALLAKHKNNSKVTIKQSKEEETTRDNKGEVEVQTKLKEYVIALGIHFSLSRFRFSSVVASSSSIL